MTRFAFVTYAALVLLLGSLTTSTTDALSLRDFLTEYVEPKEMAADTNAVGIPVPPVPPKLRGINATDTILFDVDGKPDDLKLSDETFRIRAAP